jgi:alkylated DNA repair dioxygenase AlkB
LFGKYHWIPRKEAWIAESGVRYTYSRQSYAGTGWHPALEQIAERLEQQFNWVSNGALLNYYRDGSDKMGWHSDNEPELGQYPNIAILSLGSTRQLQFRQTAEPSEKLKIDLPNGSLLWITGKTQSHWQHSLPKRAQREARISCTFRKVIR